MIKLFGIISKFFQECLAGNYFSIFLLNGIVLTKRENYLSDVRSFS